MTPDTHLQLQYPPMQPTAPMPIESVDASMLEQLVKHPASATFLAVAAAAFAWKILWPLLNSFVHNQTTHSRTQSDSLEQLSRLVADAIKRAEDERIIRISAEKERDAFYSKLVVLEAKFEVTLARNEFLEKENASLRYQHDQCREFHHLRNSPLPPALALSSQPCPGDSCPINPDEDTNAQSS